MANPYGVLDVFDNLGFINVGISSDTVEFAVNSISKWWDLKGQTRYPNANKLYITCDAGGSNGYKIKLWKVKLQEFVDKTGLEVTVSHYPPGTSKWNKVEHKLFSFINKNWRGKPLGSLAVVVNLISSISIKSVLTVDCVIDENIYQKGIIIPDKIMASLNFVPHSYQGAWNYTFAPKNKTFSKFIKKYL
jgi:hypothetical protein